MVYQSCIMAGDSDLELKNTTENQINVETYRKRVRSYVDIHLYSSALFWADKVVSLSNGDPRDVYWLAQSMFLMKQYHRAVFLLKERGLTKRHLLCKYLAARCLLEAKEFTDALQMLSTDQEMTFGNLSLNLAAPLAVCTTEEQRAVVQFLWVEDVLRAEIHQRVTTQCGDSALSRRSVYEWIEKFKMGRSSLLHLLINGGS